jgi:flagellar motility protein MotE (MotC chaperone)
MKFVRLLGMGLLYFCVATVLAQAVVLGMLWWKGTFSDDRLVAMFAALHGIHPEKPGVAKAATAQDGHAQEQPSLDEISKQRLLASLDLNLRESTLDKALMELRNLEQQVATENERLKQWQEGMDQRIARAENTVLESSLLEVQQTLMVMSPKQAKEQILKMLPTSPDGSETNAMNKVVRMFKAMPLDKRKKIMGEFKTAQESEKLKEILAEMRDSPVEMNLLRDSRNKLEGNGTNR